MNLWLVAGGSVAAIAVGIAFAGGFDHVVWMVEQRTRRRRARGRRGLVDLRSQA